MRPKPGENHIHSYKQPRKTPQMSLMQHYKAKTLIGRGFVHKIAENQNMVFFKVKTDSGIYEVIYDKRRDLWSCTCKGFSAYLKGKHCYHIGACQIIKDRKVVMKNELTYKTKKQK